MEYYKLSDSVKIRIIDDVTIVYTGRKDISSINYRPSDSWDIGYMDLYDDSEEIIEMYDAKGNKFAGNCESLEKAYELIEDLAKKGITAVIGPKAPIRGLGGKIFPNPEENAVGVYVVLSPEDKTKFTSSIRR